MTTTLAVTRIEFGSPEAMAVLRADQRLREEEAAKEAILQRAKDAGVDPNALGWYHVVAQAPVVAHVLATSEAEAVERAKDINDWDYQGDDINEAGIDASPARHSDRKSPREIEDYLKWLRGQSR